MLSRSAARAALLARPRVIAPSVSLVNRRHGSSSTHHDEHHHEEHDDGVYTTKEGFTSPAWRNGVIVSILAFVAVQYAPEANENAYLTRWLASYKAPKEQWISMNATHATQSKAIADQTQALETGVGSPVHRLRFPQALDQASPFCNGVGMSVDMSGVKVKGERE